MQQSLLNDLELANATKALLSYARGRTKDDQVIETLSMGGGLSILSETQLLLVMQQFQGELLSRHNLHN